MWKVPPIFIPPSDPEMERREQQIAAATRRLVNAYEEHRAKVALMFFRPDQLAWSYRPGETEPRIEVRV